MLGCGGDGELNDKPCSPGHVGGRSAMVIMPTPVSLKPENSAMSCCDGGQS